MRTGERQGEISRILAPTDFSPDSLPGLLQAAALSRRLGAELILMTAIPKKWAADEVAQGRYVDQLETTVRMQLAAWFSKRIPPAFRALSTRTVAIVDDPAEAILRVARTEGADLIVMATHGRSGLDRLVHGSVTEAVLHSAPCPVMTVRTEKVPAHATAAA